MPRGSRPGERRGGRQRGTPNKKTQLRTAAINAAAADSNITPLGFLLGLMRDASLLIELRVDMAAAAAPHFHAKLKAPKLDPHAPKTWTLIDAIDGQPGPDSEGKIKLVAKPKPPAADGTPGLTITPLEFLLNVMRDPALPAEQRIKAARVAAPYRHTRPTTAEPVIDSDTVTTDEYGFVVEQAFARQLRDLVIKERVALYNYATGEVIRPLRRQINELCKMLPECPSGYGADQAKLDANRLDEYCIERIGENVSLRLSAEQDAEEAHVVFRVRTYRKAYWEAPEEISEAEASEKEVERLLEAGRKVGRQKYKDPYDSEVGAARVDLSFALYIRRTGRMR
jgi:hypothetical protein